MWTELTMMRVSVDTTYCVRVGDFEQACSYRMHVHTSIAAFGERMVRPEGATGTVIDGFVIDGFVADGFVVVAFVVVG